jgi:hypothetical protein
MERSCPCKSTQYVGGPAAVSAADGGVNSVGIAVTWAGDPTTTSPPAVRGMPTEADVGRKLSQADAPGAAIAHSLMTSVEGPVAAKACSAGGTHMGCTAGALSTNYSFFSEK